MEKYKLSQYLVNTGLVFLISGALGGFIEMLGYKPTNKLPTMPMVMTIGFLAVFVALIMAAIAVDRHRLLPKSCDTTSSQVATARSKGKVSLDQILNTTIPYHLETL